MKRIEYTFEEFFVEELYFLCKRHSLNCYLAPHGNDAFSVKVKANDDDRGNRRGLVWFRRIIVRLPPHRREASAAASCGFRRIVVWLPPHHRVASAASSCGIRHGRHACNIPVV